MVRNEGVLSLYKGVTSPLLAVTAMDALAREFIEDYDNESFWEGLIQQLSGRDIVLKYGEEAVRAMNEEERREKAQEFEDKWGAELEENGVDRLTVKEG